ncbi:hypothetical protein PAXRUDRAFT_53679, partial [Paxillus rubicundulus Ve08.2h10]
ASVDTPTCLTLIRPLNLQIWKLQIMMKLWGEKALGMALGTDDFCLMIPVTSLSIPGTTATMPRAHGIIQDSISGALLLMTEAYTIAQDLFGALLSIHQASNLASTYIFQQLFNTTWSRISTVSEHIMSLWTLEAHLSGMK